MHAHIEIQMNEFTHDGKLMLSSRQSGDVESASSKGCFAAVFFSSLWKDGGCHMTDAKVCNATLQMMFSRSLALGQCICSGPDPCSTLQQLYSQCQHHWGMPHTFSTAISIMQI